MTRSEQAARTRIRILDAAMEVLVENGYSGTSTVRIQERAGLSRGGLLHQFGSRDELLVAAVGHLSTARIEALGAGRAWPTTPHERVSAAVEAMWAQYREPIFWASTELWLAARHNPALAGALGPTERELGRLAREATALFFGEQLAAHPSYADLAELLITSMRGVALAYAFTPGRNPAHDPHLEAWKDLARRTLLAP